MATKIPTTWKRPSIILLGQDGKGHPLSYWGKMEKFFSILGRCRRAAKQKGNSTEDINLFFNEAKKDDYDHFLRTVMDWFDTDPDEDEDEDEDDYNRD
jgi:hypothetical protein